MDAFSLARRYPHAPSLEEAIKCAHDELSSIYRELELTNEAIIVLTKRKSAVLALIGKGHIEQADSPPVKSEPLPVPTPTEDPGKVPWW